MWQCDLPAARKCELALSVVTLTKFRMADLAVPSFHEGSGSWAQAMVVVKATAQTIAAANRFSSCVVFMVLILEAWAGIN